MCNFKLRRTLKVFVALIFLSASAAHALTIAQILTEVRVRTKDTFTGRQRYTDAQLLNMYGAAARDISVVAQPILSTAAVTLVSGTTCYDISGQNPSGYLDIKRVTFNSVNGRSNLPETTVEQLDANLSVGWYTTGGIPTYYYFDNTRSANICFQPWPNGVSGSTGTVTIYLYQGAGSAAISDTSQEPFGSGNLRFMNYHDLFIWHMCADIYALEGEDSKVTYYRTLYEARLKVLSDQIWKKENYNPQFSGPNNSR